MPQGLTLQQLQKMGAKPNTQSTDTGGKTLQQLIAEENQPVQKSGGDFLSKATKVVNSIFPGKQIGTALGTDIAAVSKAGQAERKALPAQAAQDFKGPSFGQIAGDVGGAALTPFTLEAGTGGTALARIATNAGTLGLQGTANATAQGNSFKNVVKSGVESALVGGGLSATGEGINALSQNLPKWFTKAALPKMKDAPAYKYIPNTTGGFTKTAQEDAADYALNNTKGLSVTKMLDHSNASVEGFGKQIDTILSHPEYARETGNGAQAFQDVLGKFPDAQLDDGKLASIVKSVGKERAAIVDKVKNGTATLAEKNSLRRVLDKATKKVFTDNPSVTFNKEIAHEFADSLRGEVQILAPETVPIFSKFSKELTLNQALQKAVKKKTVAGDLVAAGAGYAHGGLKGAAEGLLLEKTLRSPSAIIDTAKAIRGVSKVVTPIAKNAFQAGKIPLIRKLTDGEK